MHANEAVASMQMDRKSLLEADSAERTGELSGDTVFPESAELLVSEAYRRSELPEHANEVLTSPVYGRYELGGGDAATSEMDARFDRYASVTYPHSACR